MEKRIEGNRDVMLQGSIVEKEYMDVLYLQGAGVVMRHALNTHRLQQLSHGSRCPSSEYDEVAMGAAIGY